MLTTLDDLLLWTQHLRRMRQKGDPLLAKLTTPARLADGRATKEAAGLRVDVRFDRRVIEHSGSNRGFNACIEWYPDDDDVEIDAPHAVVTIYGDHPSEARTASNVLEPTNAPGVFSLFGLAAGGRLSLADDAPTPTVVFEPEGRAARRFVKVDQPAAAERQSAVGRYRSHDLNVVSSLSIEQDSLVLVIERPDGCVVDRGPLVPITRNFYIMQRDPVTNIRLKRDARHRVIGFELSEPRLRAVAFERLADVVP